MNKKIKDAFDGVTAEKELIQNTEDAVIQYMYTKYKKRPPIKQSKKRNVGLVLAFVLTFVFGALFIYQQPVSAVSINKDSSIEVYFNRFNHVVEIINYDENGDPTTEDINVQNKHFEQVINELLNNIDEDEVYITVASNNNTTTTEMVANLTPYQEIIQNMHIYQSSEEIMHRARKNNMSMGRMHAINELKESDEGNLSDNVENESTHELMKTYEKHHHEMMRDGHMHNQNGGKMHNRHMNR